MPGQEPRAAGQETQGGHLARLIQEAGLNNNSLAKLSGVRRESISRVVNDHARLGPRLAERVAPPLGVTVDELVAPQGPEARLRRLERRLRELEDDRDYLLQVVRKLVTHLDHAGLGAPRMPPMPRPNASVARPPGAEPDAESAVAEPGRRRPRLSRHR
jgi:plasmid maintenance system antidote protein VapI